jgi:hypothetical protein
MFHTTFGVACNSMALITHSSKPFTGQSVLADARKFKSYLGNQPLERFGIHKEFSLATVPSVLVDMAAMGAEAMEEIGSMTAVISFAGGGLSDSIGDMLAEHGVNLVAGFGM